MRRTVGAPSVIGAPPVDRTVDRVAFSDVFHEHYRRVVRLAYLHCGDRHRAEDAVAEAMAKVYVKWRDGKVGDIGPYLRRAVVNEVHQAARRRLTAERATARRRGDLRGVRNVGEDLADRDEMIPALQQLPERQRLAIVLRFYEDLSAGEAAEVMGISVGGVKSQTSRGLQRLQELLRGEEDGR